MIIGMFGIVFEKNEESVSINNNGIIYNIYMSKRDIKEIREKEDIYINISEKIGESIHELYGFINKYDKNLFEEIIKTPKIGNKTAIKIFNIYSESEIIEIIKNQDVEAITKVAGIGQVGGSTLLLNLKRKLKTIERFTYDKPEVIKFIKKVTKASNEKIENFLNKNNLIIKDLNEESLIKLFLKEV